MNEARFTPPEIKSPHVEEAEQMQPPEVQAEFLIELITDEVMSKLAPNAQEVVRFIKEQ